WKPCAPGARPATLASTTTLSPFWVKRTAPVTLLPLVGSSLATALGAAAAPGWVSDVTPAQPARERAATKGRRLRMGLPFAEKGDFAPESSVVPLGGLRNSKPRALRPQAASPEKTPGKQLLTEGLLFCN